ncbi:1,4-alpha-glucan branching protein GlgB [Hydrogenimonas thermophila]|uniref:1,4-alpha-glucan branching enzyme GlgB n=1 Tax=Hydrogenimonas thermophila TaxID=223786 RepID=A0A1I5QIE2_9BACT|nr:1,4-alpha-glucan branching protein GlgB [Hydrogenimonas thermophila]SFP46029.1 1,4-alpha-glucan branching enzyme [Hydrogenimonas thermophila]
MNQIYYDITRFSDMDIYLFKEGTHVKLYEKMGSHIMERQGKKGVYFAVWAPNAVSVSVVADFNHYDPSEHPLKLRDDSSGIWEGFVEGAFIGQTYKYHIVSSINGRTFKKADPYAKYAEKPPHSASRICSIDDYRWSDDIWMDLRKTHNAHDKPITIYEVHLGSWRRKVEEGNRFLSYVELATELADYLVKMNYTHVEIMPITEYPFEGSWGYQVTGYFAPTARYGTPQEFMQFVDIMHSYNIGVIMDWVPSHFVTDGHGLLNFDGICLYEHEDPRLGYHPEWGSAIFNYGRNEVRAFLISSAMYWLEKFHIDGIRVDAVASMLYLNYARKDGEWLPNRYGGNENLEAVEFLKQLNETVYGVYQDIVMIAEESTAYKKVTRPVYTGGLGFGFKWNMGWMHDTLKYFMLDPIHRQHNHQHITFSMWYAFDENFLLPLSHDEVVHMKGSLINKMSGDENQKFANLRALFSYMTAHPGKKLLFMGGEFGQWREWNYEDSLDWHLLEKPMHQGLQRLVSDLNGLYKTERALYLYDEKHAGFEWIEANDTQRNVLSFIRKSNIEDETILVVCNFANRVYENYRVGVPIFGRWKEIFNSQYKVYEGWNITNPEPVETEEIECNGRKHSINVRLPALGVCFFKLI